jgi:hypothetical protein
MCRDRRAPARRGDRLGTCNSKDMKLVRDARKVALITTANTNAHR